jgi:hypothetical protein
MQMIVFMTGSIENRHQTRVQSPFASTFFAGSETTFAEVPQDALIEEA